MTIVIEETERKTEVEIFTMPEKSVEPADRIGSLLLKVADLLEKGWCQGNYQREGNYCLMGAVIKITQNTHDELACVFRLQRSIGKVAIIGWNDKPERTKEQVCAAVRKAARG